MPPMYRDAPKTLSAFTKKLPAEPGTKGICLVRRRISAVMTVVTVKGTRAALA